MIYSSGRIGASSPTSQTELPMSPDRPSISFCYDAPARDHVTTAVTMDDGVQLLSSRPDGGPGSSATVVNYSERVISSGVEHAL